MIISGLNFPLVATLRYLKAVGVWEQCGFLIAMKFHECSSVFLVMNI